MVEAKRPVREMPAWLSAAMIVICLAAGSWIVWRYWISGPPREQTIVLDRGPNDGIHALGGEHWRVQSGNAGLNLSRRKDELSLNFFFPRYDFLSAQQIDAIANGKRIARDMATARAIDVTPVQMKALREQVTLAMALDLQPADKERLKKLFEEWEQASAGKKEDRETDLLKALEEVGSRYVGTARQTFTDAAAHIQATLQPEQWHKFEEMGK